MADTIRTIIHTYRHDLSYAAGREAYQALRAQLTAQGLRCFASLTVDYVSGHYNLVHARNLDGQPIDLEIDHLFENQWNTAPIGDGNGLRVFDWAEDIYDNRSIKAGHWLEQTDEMRRIRRETLKCGYCGHQFPHIAGLTFCTDCLGSEYLKSADLALLRLLPCDTPFATVRAELTETERAELLPRYRDAQLHGNDDRSRKRIAEQRRRIAEKYQVTTAAAKAEHDGLLWLLDHGVKIDNVIYYSHTQKFAFGWRQPVDPTFKSELLDLISEFPYDYEIK